jgi:xanthine dehydrogenase accessory factor
VVTSGGLFAEFVEKVRGGRPAALATVVEGPDGAGARMLLDPGGMLGGTLGSEALDRAVRIRTAELFREGVSEVFEVAPVRVFIEIHLPPPRLVIVGAVHIAVTLARLARELGFRVVVSDARGRFATPERFPDVDELILGWPNEVLPKLALDEFSYVVVITHDAKLDNPALVAALRSPAPYVGALGSKRTHARRVKALQEAGLSEPEIGRIHAPIGIEIGARTPQEIALATMAEIVAVRNGASVSR